MEGATVRRIGDGGQAALVDAILFMTVMLVASAVIIGSAGTINPTMAAYEGNMQYTGDFARTLLALELSGMEYTDVRGNEVNLGGTGTSIGQLVCDRGLIIRNGAGKSDFTDYDARILEAGNGLIRPGMGFAIVCDDSVYISAAAELPLERFASSMTVLPGPGSEAMVITVYVWVV